MRNYKLTLTLLFTTLFSGCGSRAIFLRSGTVGVIDKPSIVSASIPDSNGKLVPNTILELPSGTEFKYSNKATKAVQSNCKECQAIAKKAENDTYKQAKSEMKAAHKAEQNRIAHQCDAEVVPLPPIVITQPNTIPDAELLPESGTFKGVGTCKDGKCR